MINFSMRVCKDLLLYCVWAENQQSFQTTLPTSCIIILIFGRISFVFFVVHRSRLFIWSFDTFFLCRTFRVHGTEKWMSSHSYKRGTVASCWRWFFKCLKMYSHHHDKIHNIVCSSRVDTRRRRRWIVPLTYPEEPTIFSYHWSGICALSLLCLPDRLSCMLTWLKIHCKQEHSEMSIHIYFALIYFSFDSRVAKKKNLQRLRLWCRQSRRLLTFLFVAKNLILFS